MEDPREAQRLTEKVDSNLWVEDHLLPRFRGQTILDVGCGPGVLAQAAAKVLPESMVTGLERSEDRFVVATQNLDGLDNARVVRGDVIEMPFESEHFDFVYTRFMLEYLPNPEIAIREMVRVCRPGGKVMLQDLDGQLVWHYPLDPNLQPMLQTVIEYMAQTGFDPFIGRKLFSMAKAAGLSDIEVQTETYHLYPGKIDEENYHLWELKLEIALPIIERALESASMAIELKERFLAYLAKDDTLTYSTLFTVTGTKLG